MNNLNEHLTHRCYNRHKMSMQKYFNVAMTRRNNGDIGRITKEKYATIKDANQKKKIVVVLIMEFKAGIKAI